MSGDAHRGRRIAAAAVVVLVLAGAAVGVGAVVRSNDAGPRTTTTVAAALARRQRDIGLRLGASGAPIPPAEAVAALQTGVERLMQLPAVNVTYTAEGTDAGPVRATGVVVPATRDLEVRQVTTLDRGSVVTEERRVVNGTVYVRVVDQPEPHPAVPWDTAPASAEPQADFDRIFVAGGRAAESLTALLDLLRAAPFTASRSTGGSTVYRLRVPARAIVEYYRSKGVHSVGGPGAAATSAYEFTVGPDNVLTDFSAYGTVFQGDEPIDSALIDVHYSAAPPPSIAAPPPAETRRS